VLRADLGERHATGGHRRRTEPAFLPARAEAQAARGDLCPPAGASDVWDCLNNPGTIYSSITEPASLTLWVRVNDRPERTWVRLDLSEALGAARVAS
jgi:hypothetical protein